MTTAVLALPEDALGCEFCGCALIPGETRGEVVEVPSLPPDRIAVRSWRGSAERFARCADCQAITDRAEAYLADHEQWAASVGRYIATEGVVSSLSALAILGRDIADKDLGLMLPRLWPSGPSDAVRRDVRGRPAGPPHLAPWSHVCPRIATRCAGPTPRASRPGRPDASRAVPIPCPSTRGLPDVRGLLGVPVGHRGVPRGAWRRRVRGLASGRGRRRRRRQATCVRSAPTRSTSRGHRCHRRPSAALAYVK